MDIRLTRTMDDIAHTAAFFLVRHEVDAVMRSMSLLETLRRRRDEGRAPLRQGKSHDEDIAEQERLITEWFDRLLDALAYYRRLRNGRLTRREVEEIIRDGREKDVATQESTALAERIIHELPARIEAHNAAVTGADPAPEHSPFDPGFGPTRRFQAWADDALVPGDTAEVPLSDVRDAWNADHPGDPPVDEVIIRKWMNGTLGAAGGIIGDKVTMPVDHHTDDGQPRRILKDYRLARRPGGAEDDEAYSSALARYSRGCPAAAMEDTCANPVACASEGRCKALPQHATA